MDLDDLTPMGGGSLRMPVTGPHRQTVAQFTLTRHVDPAEAWRPLTRMNDVTRGGQQANPYGSFGHGLEHEPVDRAERLSMHTAKSAVTYADDEDEKRKLPVPAHVQAARDVRTRVGTVERQANQLSALVPGQK